MTEQRVHVEARKPYNEQECENPTCSGICSILVSISLPSFHATHTPSPTGPRRIVSCMKRARERDVVRWCP